MIFTSLTHTQVEESMLGVYCRGQAWVAHFIVLLTTLCISVASAIEQLENYFYFFF